MTAFCQGTELVEKPFDNSKQIWESYHVRKDDGKTKEGEYVSYFQMSSAAYQQFQQGTLNVETYIEKKGNYINGKKNGEWVDYSRPLSLKGKGKYDNNEKVGPWVTAVENGQVYGIRPLKYILSRLRYGSSFGANS